MNFDKEQIEHLAKLARLEITTAEKEKYAEQIASIIDYFGKLNAIDMKNVEPLDFITELKNVWREDEAAQFFDKEKTLAACPRTRDAAREAPELKDDQIVVPNIWI
ncbi:MAG: Asp-tRNA(Asn)/Glu-tRNA(Gln) amidotransferase subunit GatC [Candidatus Falkowbacteria bacterium]